MSTGTSSTQYSPSAKHYQLEELETSRGMLPMCYCQQPMVIYIANTIENQGRRFWRCRNWQKKRKCDLFIWDDQLGPCTRPMVAVPSNVSIEQSKDDSSKDGDVMQGMSNVEPKPNNCNCVDVMQGIWEKKKDKWKLKLVQEKKKVEWLKLFVIVSWVIFVVCYAKK